MGYLRFVEVGFVKKTVGVRGDIMLVLNDLFDEEIEDLRAIFIQKPDGKVPFFINKVSWRGDMPILSVDGLDAKEKAAELVGAKVYLEENQLTNTHVNSKHTATYESLIGFKMIENDELVGVIENIEHYPQQIIAFVKNETKEYMIPLNDSFVLQIDEASQSIMVDLPDGLLAL